MLGSGGQLSVIGSSWSRKKRSDHWLETAAGRYWDKDSDPAEKGPAGRHLHVGSSLVTEVPVIDNSRRVENLDSG